MKKAILLTLAVLLIGFSANAQRIDLVNLKNGTIIRGHISEIIPEGNVTINDLAGNTWVYAMAEVASIEEADSKGYSASRFTPGIKNMTSIGFLAGSQNSQYIAPFSMQTSFGYLNNLGIYTGVATGLEFLNVNHVPLMLDINYFLKEGDVTPVAILRAGYAFPTKRTADIYSTDYTYSGGIAGSLGMGLKIRSKENFAWDISLLYRYMQINYTEKYDYNGQTNNYQDIYNRLEIRIGVYLDL